MPGHPKDLPTHNIRRPSSLLAARLPLAVTLLVVGSFIAYSLHQEHRRIEQRERERLATQAKVIDENLARQLDAVKLALEGIRRELPLWPMGTAGSFSWYPSNRGLTAWT